VHLADEQVQRVLHDELTTVSAADVQAHLAGCSACRDRVAQAEREDRWVLERLSLLDHAAPEIRPARVMGATRSSRAPGWGRWAAGILLMLALGGVAYAAPGSPLPRVLARVIQSLRASPQPVAPPDRKSAHAGIAVPAGDRLTISFVSTVSGDTAVISLSSGSDVIIRARGGVSSFASDPDRVTVDHRRDPGRFEILIPRSARLVEVEVAGRRIFRKARSGITSVGVAPDSLGRYAIPLTSP
jgi:hypothetical protein